MVSPSRIAGADVLWLAWGGACEVETLINAPLNAATWPLEQRVSCATKPSFQTNANAINTSNIHGACTAYGLTLQMTISIKLHIHILWSMKCPPCKPRSLCQNTCVNRNRLSRPQAAWWNNGASNGHDIRTLYNTRRGRSRHRLC